MSRARVLALAALAALLVSHAPRSLPDVASATDGAAAAASPPSEIAIAVAGVLREVNPSLSESAALRAGGAVVRYSRKYRLDPRLVTAVLLVESSARPWARSPKGAIGLMQVMPHMHSPLRMAGNLSTIESNIEAGCWILAGNIRRLGEEAGVQAYFWGSEIRGDAYLHRVRAVRAELERRLRS